MGLLDCIGPTSKRRIRMFVPRSNTKSLNSGFGWQNWQSWPPFDNALYSHKPKCHRWDCEHFAAVTEKAASQTILVCSAHEMFIVSRQCAIYKSTFYLGYLLTYQVSLLVAHWSARRHEINKSSEVPWKNLSKCTGFDWAGLTSHSTHFRPFLI